MEVVSTIYSAKNISDDVRKNIAINAINNKQPITKIAKDNNVSRDFVYTQKHKAVDVIEKEFIKQEKDKNVLFYLPVTKDWLHQVVLCLLLHGCSGYRGVINFFSDIFDYKISIGNISNIAHSAIEKAKQINATQMLENIKQAANDEIFQINDPILTGVDTRSLYCYLLSKEDQRDAETWGINLLDLQKQKFNPDRFIMDDGTGIRAGHKMIFPNISCDYDNFHITRDLMELRRFFRNKLKTAVSYKNKMQEKTNKAKENSNGNKYSRKLYLAKEHEKKMEYLSNNVDILISWMEHDVLNKPGPDYDTRLGLYNFILDEFNSLAILHPHRINYICGKLERQRELLLNFVNILEQEFCLISEKFNCSIDDAWKICELQRYEIKNDNYHIKSTPIETFLGEKFDLIEDAVIEALDATERTSSMVENLHSRLKKYFFLRKEVGYGYLDLLRFYLNHTPFLRSAKEFRVNKTPAEILTGKPHKHWLELLGYTRFQRVAA